ncbi:hypothetical protein [Geoalkalibacter sp.]|uniref:hypothetical protein n=1 Tax=Geoalkalibacter sp. TaxID=3041440 RepID=UPI00272ED0EB|nr:hypothetical protein [Geoalkalibacter sp.]
MTRRDIILQILVEASGKDPETAETLFSAMLAEDLISNVDLTEEFADAEAQRMLGDFRAELPGIRRWLCEAGLLDNCGHA